MLIVKRNNADIYYEGINEADCKKHMPANEEDYLILPFELYEDYVDHLVCQ